MRLSSVGSVVELGDWISGRGYQVSEGPGPYGPISPTAHTPTSLHYKLRALDVNAPGPDEHDLLLDLYERILLRKRRHRDFPLDEMFFDGRGWIKELPDDNHPISGHDTHLHVGLTRRHW